MAADDVEAPQTVQEVLNAHHDTLEELVKAVNALQLKIEEIETRLDQRIVRPGFRRLN